MRSLAFLFLLMGGGFLTFVATPASAQATRTWVSGVGDDANPCSRTAPCKTFAGAIAKTATAGEINVLDPGGFGAVTITKAITIRSDHIEAGVLVAGTNGINVAAGAADTVVLEGLDFDGTGTGLNGVNITSGLNTFIIRCAIRRFIQNGVNMASNTTGARVFIRDSFININGTNGSNPLTGGVNVQGNGVGNIASIINTEIDANQNFSLQANGTGNIIGLANSVLNASPASVSLLNGALAVSFGPSNVVSPAFTFSSTQPFR
jgi:hypothetical protein